MKRAGTRSIFFFLLGLIFKRNGRNLTSVFVSFAEIFLITGSQPFLTGLFLTWIAIRVYAEVIVHVIERQYGERTLKTEYIKTSQNQQTCDNLKKLQIFTFGIYEVSNEKMEVMVTLRYAFFPFGFFRYRQFHDNEIVSIKSGAFKKFYGPACTL